MIKAKTGTFRIADWLRTKRTLEMLGAWELEHNPKFKCGEFATFMNWIAHPGSKNFRLGVKEWVELTNAIGISASRGTYGGTFAQTDIALEFAGWVSPSFRIWFEKALEDQQHKLQNIQ